MKKTKPILMIMCLLLTLSCFLSGCVESNDAVPYISFKNNYEILQKYYYVGDEIELNGQCINYYEDIRRDDKVEKDVSVTKNMISNFSTQTVGEYNFKINYKNTSKEVSYFVYEKPNITDSIGFYTSNCFGKNVVVEITQNQIIYNYYENGFVDLESSKSTSTRAINSKLKANKDGVPSLNFTYGQYTYEFCNFVNSIPTKVKMTIKGDSHQSTQTLSCAKIG